MAVDAHRLTRGVGDRWQAVRRRYKWWQLTLFVIGVVTAVSVFSALFFAVGDKPGRIYTDSAPPPVESPHFSTALSTIVGAPVEHGGTITTLNNGDEFVPALLDAIAHAERTINFAVYIWAEGTFSDQLLAALEKKQREGVTVRVLLDGLGSIKVPDEDFEGLVDAGGKVQKFRMPKFGKLTRFHRRNHRRSIVIDGEIGFTGGMAVADIWLGNAQDKKHWRDIMFRVTGPLARSLQSAFVDLWVSSSGELLIDPKNYPVTAPAAVAGVEQIIHLASSPADDDQSMAYFFLLPILSAREIHLSRRSVLHSRQAIAVGPRRESEERSRRAAIVARTSHRQLDHAGERAGAVSGAARGWHKDLRVSADLHARQVQPHRRQVVHHRLAEPELAVAAARRGERTRRRRRRVRRSPESHVLQDLERSTQVDLEKWRRRNPLQKFFETISRILDQQS